MLITHADYVRSFSQKRMIPKCSNTLEVILFWGSKVKDQGHRVNKFILYAITVHTRTAIQWHSLAGITSCLWFRGCLVHISLTFARWCNQLSGMSAWDWTLDWVPSRWLKLLKFDTLVTINPCLDGVGLLFLCRMLGNWVQSDRVDIGNELF